MERGRRRPRARSRRMCAASWPWSATGGTGPSWPSPPSELDAGAREKIRAAHGGLIAMIVEALGDLGHEQPRLAAMLLQGVGGRGRAPYRTRRGGGAGRDHGRGRRHGPARRPGLTPGPGCAGRRRASTAGGRRTRWRPVRPAAVPVRRTPAAAGTGPVGAVTAAAGTAGPGRRPPRRSPQCRQPAAQWNGPASSTPTTCARGHLVALRDRARAPARRWCAAADRPCPPARPRPPRGPRPRPAKDTRPGGGGPHRRAGPGAQIDAAVPAPVRDWPAAPSPRTHHGAAARPASARPAAGDRSPAAAGGGAPHSTRERGQEHRREHGRRPKRRRPRTARGQRPDQVCIA